MIELGFEDAEVVTLKTVFLDVQNFVTTVKVCVTCRLEDSAFVFFGSASLGIS